MLRLAVRGSQTAARSKSHAAPRLIVPYYAVPLDSGWSLNAYYQDPETKDWTPWTVRIVPSTDDTLLREAQEARGARGEHRGREGGT